MQDSSQSSSEQLGKIAVLPQDVVNRIAAGEVVQKPVSAIKELLENSLDAKATDIRVRIEGHGYSKIVISDNGCGIPKSDLALAAVRHATSKLRSVDDFETLQSFGFRGEALASVSMVSRLSIHSRTDKSPVGFSLSYLDGTPTMPQPKPMARKVGTTVTVEDLFYNLPNRQKRNASATREEYSKIVQVVQNYAVLYASQGVGFVCEKRGNKAGVDVNTTSGIVHSTRQAIERAREQNKQQAPDDAALKELQARATKEVICQLYGSSLKSQLQSFCFSWQGKQGDDASLECTGYISSPSYAGSKKTNLILFVNQRLVESRQIQRKLEEVCGDFSKNRPFLFLSLTVPPNAVDVNVHPSKRQVTLLFFDEICQQLTTQCREALSQFGQSFDTAENLSSTANSARKAQPAKRKRPSDEDDEEEAALEAPTASSKQKNKGSSLPSKLIRTSRSSQVGALEPYLVASQPTQSSQLSLSQSTQSSTVSAEETPASQSALQHKPGCPLATESSQASDVDLSQPGAFAAVVSQCTCRTESSTDLASQSADTVIRLPRQAITRPRRTPPTPCTYTSIQSLRQSIHRDADRDVLGRLRKACFVGAVSLHRSFVQEGEDLILFNHYEAAKELFYQLALNRFHGGPSMQAKLGQSIDIRAIIADMLELEDIIQRENNSSESEDSLKSASFILTQSLPMEKVSETNASMADQVATSLLKQSEMLRDYFSIGIAQTTTKNAEGSEEDIIVLDSLPVLLDDYTPCIHGLPLFLLRLATEVDWTEEKPCFHGVCRELASFYAQMESEQDDHHIRHVLFPAVSTLLLPSKSFVENGFFRTTTKLSKLYRTFERC